MKENPVEIPVFLRKSRVYGKNFSVYRFEDKKNDY